jgi:hypothetical protein
LFEQSAEQAEAETKYLVAANWHLQINYPAGVRACAAPLRPAESQCRAAPARAARATRLHSNARISSTPAIHHPWPRENRFSMGKVPQRVLVADSHCALRCLAPPPPSRSDGDNQRVGVSYQERILDPNPNNSSYPLSDLGGLCSLNLGFPVCNTGLNLHFYVVNMKRQRPA